MDFLDFNPSTLSLSICLLICGYLSVLCVQSPNPDPDTDRAYKGDRISALQDVVNNTTLRSPAIMFFYLFHVALLLIPTTQNRAKFCRNPSFLNAGLFTWSGYTTAYIVTVLIAAPIRLLSYAHLGKNFTFKLAKPSKLVTTGVYAYVQHPSYTALCLVCGGNFLFAMRTDGTAACWIPAAILRIPGLDIVWPSSAAAFLFYAASMRVRDEERMLKEAFGKEWENWHANTKRFVPGII